MFPIRVKVCSESDLRMLGSLARNIQRVLPVTQADIDAAAALGKGWVVWKVIEVSDPLDNLRGGTQLVIKQNSVQPGQNVRRVIFVSGPGGETVVIGPAPSPLLLPDAIANSLSYVKAYGGTEQNGTPTPDALVDIVSNNGVLKARHQSGLPLGYTQLTYIQSNGNQVINTGYVLQETDSVEVDYNLTDLTRMGDKFILGVQPIADASIGGFWVETYNNSNVWYIRYGSSTSASTYGSVTPTSQLSGTLAISKNSFVVNGVEILTPNFVSMPVNPMTIFNRISLDGSIENKGASAQISEVRVKNGNNIVHRYIAVRNSNNELGMYDMVSGQFFTNQGTGVFTAGDPVNDPVEIYTDGTVETIKDSLNNTATAEMLLKVGDYTDVQEILSGNITRNVGIKVLDGTENWAQATTSLGVYRYRFEPTDAPKLDGGRGHCISTHFFDIGGVSTQDIGGVFASTTFLYFIPNQDIDTVAKWTTYLADQYAAGTPVIVVYPLAEPTTEVVAGQNLQVTQGDNTLEITQASLTGLELEAEYEQGVQASVEEIEP